MHRIVPNRDTLSTFHTYKEYYCLQTMQSYPNMFLIKKVQWYNTKVLKIDPVTQLNMDLPGQCVLNSAVNGNNTIFVKDLLSVTQ